MWAFASTIILVIFLLGFPGGPSFKEPTCKYRRPKRHRFNPWVGKIPWRKAKQPTPVFLPGESHGQRTVSGYFSNTSVKFGSFRSVSVLVCRLLVNLLKVKLLSCFRLFATLWTVACQAPPSMSKGFSKQKYWSGFPLPSPGNLPIPGIELGSPTSQAYSLPENPS